LHAAGGVLVKVTGCMRQTFLSWDVGCISKSTFIRKL